MKRIFLNLKRFDISPDRGGVNRLAPIKDWAGTILDEVGPGLTRWQTEPIEFVFFLPEAHLIQAVERCPGNVKIGSQGVFRADTAVGGNFGAFTTNRTANAVAEMGCSYTMIGHCEERNDKNEILSLGGATDLGVTNRILNSEVMAAQQAGLDVLYCIGEKSEEQEHWQQVLGDQLSVGLDGVDLSRVCIGYEPVWSIGPGKTPAGRDYIAMVSAFVKKQLGDTPVVYGGGLKQDNAAMLASIDDIDGGLIALTRFTGEIGFYPQEFLQIVELYMSAAKQ